MTLTKGRITHDVKGKIFANIVDFGAVDDGVTDNTTAIQAAINTGLDVFVPHTDNGFYFTGVLTFSTEGQSMFGTGHGSWLKPNTTGGNTIKLDADNLSMRNLRVEGTAAGVFILGGTTRRQFIEIKDNWFFGVSQCVWLFNVDHVQLVGNHFEECGYQIIQQLFFSSNHVTVANNVSLNCSADFVELNCEREAPSTDWTIVGNTVKNIGMGGAPNADGSIKTESRFVGVTLVDGVIIANNVVEGVAGDSAIHLERPGTTIITGNTLRDCNGAGGAARFVYLLPSISGLPAGWVNRQHITITDNHFITTQSALTSSTVTWVNTAAVTDFNRVIIKNNHFLNYGADYPADLTTPEGNAIVIGFTLGECTVKDNTFRNFALGVTVQDTQGGSPILDYYTIVNNNIFYKTTTPLQVTNTSGHVSEFIGNTFNSCGNNSFAKRPFRAGSNTYTNMAVSGFQTQVLRAHDIPNIYENSTHDDARAGIVVSHGVATNLFKLNPRCSLIVTILAENTSNATNNRREVFYVSNRYGDFESVSLGTGSNGTAPTITLTGTGTNQEQVQVTITGGVASNHTVYAQISGFESI